MGHFSLMSDKVLNYPWCTTPSGECGPYFDRVSLSAERESSYSGYLDSHRFFHNHVWLLIQDWHNFEFCF